MNQSNTAYFFSTLFQVLCGLAGVGLIVSGFDPRNNPGLPVAGAIVIFTLCMQRLIRNDELIE